MATTIQQFFTSYLDGFRRQQAEVLADSYTLPVLVASHYDQVVLSDRIQVLEYCQKMIVRHADQNLRPERFTTRSLLMLGDEFAVANVAWSMLAPNRGMKTYHTAYNLRRSNGDWMIWAVTTHEESDG